jgi:para-nitrobenzyl esterase
LSIFHNHVPGLFHKAILQSGSTQPAVSREEHQRVVANTFARVLGVEPGGLTIAKLGGLSAEQVLAAQTAVIQAWGQREVLEAGPLLFQVSAASLSLVGRHASSAYVSHRHWSPPQPVVDGELLPAPQLQLLEGGACRGVPVIVGYTKDEDELFRELTPPHFDCHGCHVVFRERVRLYQGTKQSCLSPSSTRR